MIQSQTKLETLHACSSVNKNEQIPKGGVHMEECQPGADPAKNLTDALTCDDTKIGGSGGIPPRTF